MHYFTLITTVLLAVALAADPTCKEGIKEGKACCPRACGTCGGPKCGLRSRMTKSYCCEGSILDSHKNCLTSDAPCKITHTKPGHKAGSNKPDPTCERGLLKRKACCPAECSTCGGEGCLHRGRLIKSDCCVESVVRRNKSCFERGPPCVVQEPEMTKTPEAELPVVCHKMRTAVVGGCFCYLVIMKEILPRRRKQVLGLCKETFGSRKVIKQFASKCERYVVGKRVDAKKDRLVEKVNELIPVCLPGSPLIKLRHN